MENILLIDDTKSVINELKTLFSEKNNFHIIAEDNLENIKKSLKEFNFFIVILNYKLFDKYQEELYTTLKENNVNTLILSKSFNIKIIKSMKDLNVIDYILSDSLNAFKKVYDITNILLHIKGSKVLLIEDKLNDIKQLKLSLESLLFEVLIVENGLEAIKTISMDSDISMIISDYEVEHLNGLDLTKNLRNNRFYSETPIIILGDGKNLDLKVELFKNGINDYMIRPIVPEVFKTKILNIFSNLKHIDELNTFYKIFDENIIASSTDNRGFIKNVSSAFCKISGYSKSELIGKQHNIVRHPEMPKSIYKEMWETIQAGKTWKGEIKNLRKDGTYYWVSTIIEPVFNKHGQINGYEAVRTDITDKKRIYELSIKDGLTELFNRRYFNEIAQDEINNSARNNKYFAFLLLDIDNFKKYNDTYGHQKGDVALLSFAKSLKNTFKRSDDTVFRLGGEEFGVFSSTNDINDIYTLAESARLNIQALNIEHKKNLPSKLLTVSLGLAIIKLNEEKTYSLDYIYKIADEQLYNAKENGRNRIEAFEVE